MPTRPARRRALLILALSAAAARPARAGFDFWASEYTASRAELQALIARQFPRSQRYAEIVRLTLADPQLALDAPANRAALAARVVIDGPFVPAGRVDGAVTMSSALRYDPAARALRLDRPRIEQLAIQGVAPADAERLQRIAGPIVQDLLQGQVLRRFTAEELTVGLKTYEIGAITVLDDGIKVELK